MDEVIVKNPCDNLKAPSIDTKEKEPLTPVQVRRFQSILDAAKPRPSLVAFRLCLFAGLRRGEVVAVRWKDFDEEAGTIKVCRSLCTASLEFKEPKTKAGNRTIPLDPATVKYLKLFKAIQAQRLFGTGTPIDEACICAKAGTDYMHPENLTRSLARFCKTYEFAGVTPHLLRHTYCTMLFAAGENLKTAQYLMGHDDPMTTMRVYAHYVESQGLGAGNRLGAFIESQPVADIVKLDTAKGRWGVYAEAV